MRILAFAYACQPDQGSELGAGWAWARMLAQLGETWVITRRDYEESIEGALPSVRERQNLRFVYVELPDRFRLWQRDQRGLRVYYLLWQALALREARRIGHRFQFDIVWHLTWANAWYGSLAALAGRPFVYGPVGGCVGTVWRLLPHLGWRGAAFEIARSAVLRGLARYLNPLARLSWRRADLILAQNQETRDWFPERFRSKVRVFPNAVIADELTEWAEPSVRSGTPVALFAGQLVASKGVTLCLHALVLLPEWRLVICGSGYDEQRLRRLARRLGVAERVAWLGWLSQEQVLRWMGEADVLLFPSLHDGAPAVVAEARAVRLPIVCLARGGAPLLAGPAGVCVADTGGVRAISQRLANAALMSLAWRRRDIFRTKGPETLALASRTEALRALLAETLSLRADSTGALHPR